MAYLNGNKILFSPKIHTDPASEYKLQQAREEGKAAGWDEFWDGFQSNGTRVMYNTAFTHWGAEYIRPKYKVVPTNLYSCNNTFYENRNLKKLEAAHFDFSNKARGTAQTTGYAGTFYGCSELTEIEDVGLVPQYTYHQTFYNCKKLKTIAKMGVDVDTKFNNAFYQCYELENLTIDGKIGQNGFDVKHCTKLSRASIESVINALTDDMEHLNTIGDPTVTLSKTAVENAFTIKDDVLSLPYSTDNTQIDGITVTDNGDGSLTINGTTNTAGLFYYLKRQSEFELPKGTYKVELDGDTTNSIIFALETGDSSFQNNGDWAYTNGENARAFLVFQTGVTYNNVTVRPKILCDEWDSLKHNIIRYWEIKEE